MNLKLYEYAYENFNKFICDNFDEKDSKISHKVNHIYNVVENVKYICGDMKLDAEILI